MDLGTGIAAAGFLLSILALAWKGGAHARDIVKHESEIMRLRDHNEKVAEDIADIKSCVVKIHTKLNGLRCLNGQECDA